MIRRISASTILQLFISLFILVAVVPFMPDAGIALGMAAVTVTRRRSDITGGNRRIRLFTITVAADGDTLDTRLRKIETVNITNPQDAFSVTGTLVAGTIGITDARIHEDSHAIVSRVSNAGTDGHLEVTVADGEITVTSSSGADTSVVEVSILPPRVTGHSISGGTLTFDVSPSASVAGVLVEVKGF